MKGLHMTTFTLLVIGGLNWLLEAFGWGIGRWLPDALETIIYIVIGLSAIYEIAAHKGNCKKCGAGSSMSTGPTA
jgi:uncharacterized membrane protein YuzA (DUF378 family)